MAQAQLDKFISFVSTNPIAWQEASQESNDPEQLLRNVVQYAQGKGYDFTEEEVKAWATDYAQRPADGALTDSQLEAVAGGTEIRNKREMETTAYEAMQQNQQQAMNTLSAFVKALSNNHSGGAKGGF